jgi:hypothetical protein
MCSGRGDPGISTTFSGKRGISDKPHLLLFLPSFYPKPPPASLVLPTPYCVCFNISKANRALGPLLIYATVQVVEDALVTTRRHGDTRSYQLLSYRLRHSLISSTPNRSPFAKATVLEVKGLEHEDTSK